MDSTTQFIVIVGVLTITAIARVGRGISKGVLIEPLPKRLAKELKATLEEGEDVRVQLCGAFQQALVCTDSRVMLIKGGWMAGQLFGCNVFQLRYRSVSGVEVKYQLMTGFLEISSGGIQNMPRNFWTRKENRSASSANNCISIYRNQAQKFRQACSFILKHVDAMQLGHGSAPAAPDPVAQIGRLSELLSKGVISQDEFNAKKAELLARV